MHTPEGVSPFTANTLDLVVFLWSSADVTVSDNARLGGMQKACVAFIRAMIARATTHLRPDHTCMTLAGVQCRVCNGGQMTGFQAAVRGTLQSRTCWQALGNQCMLLAS